MPSRELPGTIPPQEIITDLRDKRLFEITLAGTLNNRFGLINRLVEQDLIKLRLAEPSETGLSPFDLATSELRRVLENPALNPEIKNEYDRWYTDLYMGGFKRVFGYKAANRQSELRSVHWDYNPNPLPEPVFIGELPELLGDDATVEAFQERLDYRFGRHGVLAGPPPVVMALYEDIAVSLRPSARTLIQGKTEIWQLETRTDLRGPSTARMAA